jgi:hypothetical protein
MRGIVGKLILEATLAQNFRSFYFAVRRYAPKLELFLTMLGKITLEPSLLLTSATPL